MADRWPRPRTGTSSGTGTRRPWRHSRRPTPSEKFPLALDRPADGTTLAVISHLGTAELWGFDTRKRRATLVYNDGGRDLRPFAARFSPDGKVLATGSAKPNDVVDRHRYISGVLKLFDVATGREDATLLGQDGAIGCLAFTPDGKTLASGSPFNSLLLWDVPGRALKAKLSGHKDRERFNTGSWPSHCSRLDSSARISPSALPNFCMTWNRSRTCKAPRSFSAITSK